MKKVTISGVDTASLPRLSAKESRQLLLKIKEGDVDSRDYFIVANFRLVLSLAHRYINRVSCMDDLFQIGCVGLIKSVDNFNTDLDVAFSTYAVPMIIGEMRRYIRESNSLRVSRGIRDVAYMSLKAREQLELESNSDITVEDISAKIGVPVSRIVYCLDAISEPISLCDKVYNRHDDNLTIMDTIADSRQSESIWTDNVCLHQALLNLEDREKDIVYKRYFLDKTQTEISKEIGISQAQVSRLEKNAIGHLRDNMS